MANKYPRSRTGFLNKKIWDNIEQFGKAWETMISLSETEKVTWKTFPYDITKFQWMNLAGLYNSSQIKGFGNINKIFENEKTVAPIGKKQRRRGTAKKKGKKKLNRNIWVSGKQFHTAWFSIPSVNTKLDRKDFNSLSALQFSSLSSYHNNKTSPRSAYNDLANRELALDKKKIEKNNKATSKFLTKSSSKKGKKKFSYKEYLGSPHWRVFRDSYRKTSYYKAGCAVCGADAFCVHHRNYDCLTRETLSDVMPLCNNCHKKMHGIGTSNHYTSKNMLRKQETLLLCEPWETQMAKIDRYYKTVDGK